MTGACRGLMAEFDRPEKLIEAVSFAQKAGYTRIDAFSPFPLGDINRALGHRLRIVPYIPLFAAFVGGMVQYYAQYWMNAVDYPINVGGRPLHSWPAFLPSTIIVAILWAGIAIFLTILIGARLPRLHHPVFDVPGFERASHDRFFLWIKSDDPRFHRGETEQFLMTLGPNALQEVPE